MKNYLDDAIGIHFTNPAEYAICSDEHLNCRERATICGKCYQDPDLVSKQLYNDISQYFTFDEKKLNSKCSRGFLYLAFDKIYEHELSTDYIGPSRAWAKKYLSGNLPEKSSIIGDFLLASRTIGGHVFWPAHQVDRKNTINQVRGGSGIYDRFDITLAELKHYFETQIECEKNQRKDNFLLYQPLYDAFKRYAWFFSEYQTFENYIEKMKLDMFLHRGDVFSLVDSNVEKEDYVPINRNSFIPQKYENYIRNCKHLILKRTNMILNSQGPTL